MKTFEVTFSSGGEVRYKTAVKIDPESDAVSAAMERINQGCRKKGVGIIFAIGERVMIHPLTGDGVPLDEVETTVEER
jgi:hypothetical protein